jgi:hypothetical protein
MRRKFNAVKVLVVGNGQRKEVFWERVTIHYNSNRPFALNPKNERNLQNVDILLFALKVIFGMYTFD